MKEYTEVAVIQAKLHDNQNQECDFLVYLYYSTKHQSKENPVAINACLAPFRSEEVKD
jgi:hypothetical protein